MKSELLKYIEEEYSSSFSEYELYSLLIYPTHLSATTLNGLRLTSLGLKTYSKYNEPYVYEKPVVLTPYAILQLSKLPSPWYFAGSTITIFDLKLFCKLKLMDDFKRFLVIL